MGDALSQEQIDALLNSAINGEIEVSAKEEPKESIKDFDFRAPKKFGKDRMKMIDTIFDTYSRLLSSYLTGLLRLYCKVSLVSIEEQHYYEFNNALPDYVIMGLVDLQFRSNDDEDEVPVIIQISNTLTFSMIERLLGGNGRFEDLDRDFTEIETGVMYGILKKFTDLFKDSWTGYADVTPVLEKIESNSRVVSTVSYDDVMIIAALEVKVNEAKSVISVCIPAIALGETMQTHVSYATHGAAKKTDMRKDGARKDNIMTSLVNSDLPVKAVLGTVTLDLLDVMSLQVNDIIPLKKGINTNIEINIGKRAWFDGKLGVYNKRKAVKIENIYKPKIE